MVFDKDNIGNHVKYLGRTLCSVIITLSMIFTMNVSTVLAVNSLNPNYNTNIDIKTDWLDEDNQVLDYDFNFHPQNATPLHITQRVSYSSQKVNQDYETGSLSIVVKGLKDLYRNNGLKATVAADEATSTIKVKDWSYTYNDASDEYIFTNNNKIAKDSNLDGFFTLIYTVNPTEAKHGYDQDKMNAVLYYPDGTFNKSNELSFKSEIDKNSYQVDIVQGDTKSNSGLNGYVAEDQIENYGLLNLLFSSTETLRGRGLEDYEYVVTLPKDIIVCNNSVKAESLGNNQYRIKLVNPKDATKNYMYIAVPTSYLGQKIKSKLALNGHYYDDEPASTLPNITSKDLEIQLPNSFSYKTPDGGVYNLQIQTDKTTHLLSSKTQTPSGQNSTTYVQTSYYKKNEQTVELETVIDHNFISKENGNYRLLNSDEYDIKNIATNSTLNDAKQQITYGQYEIWACNSAKFTKQTLVQSGQLKDLKNIKLQMPEGTKSVGIVYKGVTEGFESLFRINTNVHSLDQDTLFNGGRLTKGA